MDDEKKSGYGKYVAGALGAAGGTLAVLNRKKIGEKLGNLYRGAKNAVGNNIKRRKAAKDGQARMDATYYPRENYYRGFQAGVVAGLVELESQIDEVLFEDQSDVTEFGLFDRIGAGLMRRKKKLQDAAMNQNRVAGGIRRSGNATTVPMGMNVRHMQAEEDPEVIEFQTMIHDSIKKKLALA